MAKKEVWKEIPGYEGRYWVSNCGEVKSLSWGMILYKDKKGYMKVCLCKGTKRKNYYVHRLVLTVFDRPPKEKEQCNHKDGIKDNNFVENLEWCTCRENCLHKCRVLGKRGILSIEVKRERLRKMGLIK